MVKEVRIPFGFEEFVSSGNLREALDSSAQSLNSRTTACRTRGYHLVKSDTDSKGRRIELLYCHSCRERFNRIEEGYRIKKR